MLLVVVVVVLVEGPADGGGGLVVVVVGRGGGGGSATGCTIGGGGGEGGGENGAIELVVALLVVVVLLVLLVLDEVVDDSIEVVTEGAVVAARSRPPSAGRSARAADMLVRATRTATAHGQRRCRGQGSRGTSTRDEPGCMVVASPQPGEGPTSSFVPIALDGLVRRGTPKPSGRAVDVIAGPAQDDAERGTSPTKSVPRRVPR